jgi:hypothetical protein
MTASSSAICWLSAGWAMWMVDAAREKLLHSTILQN